MYVCGGGGGGGRVYVNIAEQIEMIYDIRVTFGLSPFIMLRFQRRLRALSISVMSHLTGVIHVQV